MTEAIRGVSLTTQMAKHLEPMKQQAPMTPEQMSNLRKMEKFHSRCACLKMVGSGARQAVSMHRKIGQKSCCMCHIGSFGGKRRKQSAAS
jgi:hypothetical protein